MDTNYPFLHAAYYESVCALPIYAARELFAGGSLSQIAQIQKKQIWESFEQPEFIRWMIDVLNYFRFMMMNPTLCNLDSTKKIVDTFQYELEKIIWKKKSWECQLIIQC